MSAMKFGAVRRALSLPVWKFRKSCLIEYGLIIPRSQSAPVSKEG